MDVNDLKNRLWVPDVPQKVNFYILLFHVFFLSFQFSAVKPFINALSKVCEIKMEKV